MKLANKAKLREIYAVMYQLRKEAGICAQITCPYLVEPGHVRCRKHLTKGNDASKKSLKRHGVGICATGMCIGKAVKGELLCQKCIKKFQS